MAPVQFEVRHEFAASPRAVWDELVNWERHADWVPLTRMEVEPGDPTAIGARFTALTGLGPLALRDRMQVESCEWNEALSTGTCEVAKLGPILLGRAGFTVKPDGEGAVLTWYEDVTVRYAPRFTAPVLTRVGAAGFATGMRKLAKLLAG